jgi:hypothetical protein
LAAAALNLGSLYYDANGFIKKAIPIPLTDGNLITSGNPAVDHTWTYNKLAFNATLVGGSWGLSSSFLSNIGFNWTAPWMFVIKCKSSGSNLRAVLAIDPIAQWSNSYGLYEESVLTAKTPFVYIRYGGFPNTVSAFLDPNTRVNNVLVDNAIKSANGCFIVYSWSGTQTQVAKIEFFTSTGSLLYSSQYYTQYMTNFVTPIAFYSDFDEFDFLQGVYFKQGYQPYSVWGPNFQ